MKIVIADDVGFVREMISTTYIQLGHTIVAEATNGQEAIDYALKYNPDILFLDLVLPIIQGLEAAKEILTHKPDIKIVAMSSLSELWIQEKVATSGCSYFLKKPFTKEELVSVINKVGLGQQELKYG